MSLFDRSISRYNTGSVKWDMQERDCIPMWIADMDFAAAEPITRYIKSRMEHPVFGYTRPADSLNQAVADYYKRTYGYTIEKEWLVWMQGVNFGNNVACRTLGGSILFNTPMYSHINLKLGTESEKSVIKVPLKEEGGRYTFDFEAMERTITPEVTSFILCNPHNPVGRVYTREELEKLVDFALEHHITVVSDEIHSDLVLEGEHIPFFTVNEKAREISIVHHSATKTYNIPGLPLSYAVIPNEKLRTAYEKTLAKMSAPLNIIALGAAETAFTKCGEWHRELLAYLRENQIYLESRIESIPGLSINHNEATYLGWIDARDTEISEPQAYFKEQAKVHFNDGRDFCQPGFVRINFACPRAQLKEALDRVEDSLLRIK